MFKNKLVDRREGYKSTIYICVCVRVWGGILLLGGMTSFIMLQSFLN